MRYLKIKYLHIFLIILILFSNSCGFSKYDYSIHKPKVLYKPSLKALDKINRSNLGKRYVWAEEGPWSYDCSGLTYFTFGTMGIEIPRVSSAQFREGTPVKRSELKKGDLVFFDTGKHFTGRVNHVGIYIGNGKFIQASSAKKKVVITSLDKPFYKQRYLGARRYYNFTDSFKPRKIEDDGIEAIALYDTKGGMRVNKVYNFSKDVKKASQEVNTTETKLPKEKGRGEDINLSDIEVAIFGED